MNKTVNQSSTALVFTCSFPLVFVISFTLETHVLFETRIRCEKLPKMMFQRIVLSLSLREEAQLFR